MGSWVGETTAIGKPSPLSPEKRFEKYEPPKMMPINPSNMIAPPPNKYKGLIFLKIGVPVGFPVSAGGEGGRLGSLTASWEVRSGSIDVTMGISTAVAAAASTKGCDSSTMVASRAAGSGGMTAG